MAWETEEQEAIMEWAKAFLSTVAMEGADLVMGNL